MMSNLKNLPIGQQAPDMVHCVIEIPKGTRNKVEYDSELEIFKLDRVLFSAVHYPAAYGFIPSTLWHDQDPLDALIITDEPLLTGIVLDIIPIGGLEMEDDRGNDLKIIAVAAFDPNVNTIKDLSEISDARKAEIAQFFNTYKTLEKKNVEVGTWIDAHAAREHIGNARLAHENGRKKVQSNGKRTKVA